MDIAGKRGARIHERDDMRGNDIDIFANSVFISIGTCKCQICISC